MKLKVIPANHIEVEGNKGGSFVYIGKHEVDGLCYLSVGVDCVMRVQQTEIEVTKLARIIADALNP